MLFKGLTGNNARRREYVFAAAILLWAFFMLAAPHFGHAQEKILGAAMLQDKTEKMPLGQYTVVQKDPTNRINVQSITSSDGSILSGQLSKEDMITLDHDGAPVWLSTKLYNEGDQSDWIINFGKKTEGRIGSLQGVKAYELTLSIVEVDGVKKNAVALQKIHSIAENGAYSLNIKKGEQKIVLFNIIPATGKSLTIPFDIYSQSAYLSAVKSQASTSAAYTFSLVAVALIFIGNFVIRRHAILLIAGAYFAFSALRWCLYDSGGSSIEPGIVNGVILFLVLMHSLLSILMTKTFCRIESSNFTEKYILYGLAWFSAVSIMLVFFLPISNETLYVALMSGGPIITMAVIALMSFAQAKNGHIKGYLYFYSWVLPSAAAIITVLSACQILPYSSLLLNMFWYSLIPQGILLILAIRQKLESGVAHDAPIKTGAITETLNLSRIKETKDSGDHSRLLKVIEQERQMLADLRMREELRTEEMRFAKEEADEANRAKSAFLAVVSHEIRTPMTGVMGMVRLLLESNITKQQRDYVLTIQESSEAMLTLLNDILDFEKIQRGKIDLENISFDLIRLIQGVITLMSGHAAQKQITLSARIDEDIPRYVKGDPTRLRQVLLNLMGNALKFTERGNVILHVKNLNSQDDVLNKSRYSIYFAVQDSGIGISPEAQKNLFNPFAQASESITRKFGGTGLGLAISKGLIEKMGSSININSKEGEGSTFFFTLMMERGLSTAPEAAKKPVVQEEPLAPVKPLNVLVVDDNSITRKVVMSFLEQGNHHVAVAGTAEEGLKKINETPYDLVLMDIELPGMHGNEAVRILRESGDSGKQSLPVFAMTGNVGKEDMERYLADGMSGVLPKPIDLDKLRSLIVEISRNGFVREIKALGDSPKAVQKTVMESRPAPPAEYEGIFNTDMLQSLKDTLGKDKLNGLLVELVEKTQEILQLMINALDAGDLSSLAARAHELKGMAGNFGLTEISALAAQAEQKASKAETEGLDAIVALLPEASSRAQNALKNWAGE